MDIIFKDKFVKYNQISNVPLMEIHDVLIDNDIYIDLGDDDINDWAGYSYYYCKMLNELDDKAISSFVNIVTWFMTNNEFEINPNFKSDEYFRNDLIVDECLVIYNSIVNYYDSEVDVCKKLFEEIYDFYLNINSKFLKKCKLLNCFLTYREFEMFENIDCKTKRDRLLLLLEKYYDD